MLKGYGGNSLTFTISTNVGSAAALTDLSVLNDGRTGLAGSFSFSNGTAALTQHTDINVTVSSCPLDGTANAPWGIVALLNVQGLPVGTLCKFNGVSQRLAYGPRRELQAIWICTGVTGAGPNAIQIYNDVNGSHSITPGATCAAGEVYVGRIIQLPTLAQSQPASDRNDPTQTNITAGGVSWQLMRKARRVIPSGRLGLFSNSDVKSDATSTIVSGANPAGVISIESLIDFIGVTQSLMVCDISNKGGAGSVVSGIRYDQDFMQQNWWLARPMSVGGLVRDQDPFWTWGPQYQEAI